MSTSGRIIKSDKTTYRGDANRTVPQRTRSRIPSDHVGGDAPNAGPSAPQKGRVLKGKAARLRSTPVDLQEAEYSADFPLNAKEADPSETDRQQLREELEAEWTERLEEAEAAAYERGREDGRSVAAEEMEAELAAHREAFSEDAAQMRAAWQQFINESKPLLSRLAFDIAEYLLDANLPPDVKGVSERAITQAVEDLAGGTSVTVSLHPVDHLRLEESGIVEQLNAVHPDLQWSTDAEMEEGDWCVQSSEAMLRHFREELLQKLDRRLGLLDVAQHFSD